MVKVILLILLSELWGVTGQIFYKKSVNSIEAPNLRSISSSLGFVRSLIAMPTIWIGFSFITVAIMVWLLALAQADLSIVFPMDSMQYIITIVAAYFFLGEKINRLKFIGTMLVLGGIILVAIS